MRRAPAAAVAATGNSCRRVTPAAAVAATANSCRWRATHVVAKAAAARFGGGGDRGGAGSSIAERPSDIGIVERAGWDADRDSAGGVATLARPDAGDGAGDRGRHPPGGAYRLLLLDAPAHTENRVVAAITGVVGGVDEAHAKNCYATSKQLGMALVVSCLREHAEHYRAQLFVRGIKTAIEPDTA